MKTIYKICFILLLSLSSISYGWDDELKAAAKAIEAGTATAAQKRMVIKENVTINEMATQGEISDSTYQKSQQAHQEMVNKNSRAAASEAGTSISNSDTPADAKSYAAGTDTDLGLENAGDAPVTTHQAKKTRENFNRKMNQDLKTSGVDYAKKHDVDFMPDPKGQTQKSFTEGNKFNKEPYKSMDATNYELNKKNKIESSVTESTAYVDEMQGQGKHKTEEIKKLKEEAISNKTVDPDGKTAKSQSTDAQITQKQQKQQKYNERIKSDTANIHKNSKLKSDLTDSSDLSKRAADRHRNVTKEKAAEIANKKLDKANKINPDDVKIKEIDTPTGKKKVAVVPDGKGGHRIIDEADITKLNKNNAHTADAVNDHLTKQALQNNAEVRASAANASTDPSIKQQQLTASAESGNKLTPNKQGELIDNVRLKDGDDAARELASEMKRQKKEGPGAKQKTPDDTPSKAKSDVAETKVADTDVDTAKTKTDVEATGTKANVDADGPKAGGPESKVAGGEIETGKVKSDIAPETKVTDTGTAGKTKTDVGVETKVAGADAATPGKAKPSVDANTKVAVDPNAPKASGVDAPSKAGKALEAVGTATDGLDILNTAQDIKDVLSGKKSATDAAIDTTDRLLGGAVSTGKTLYKKADDLNETKKINAYTQTKYDEARALEAGLNLRKNGVSKEETMSIMAAMRAGDDSLLTDKVGKLNKSGADIKIPERELAEGAQGADWLHRNFPLLSVIDGNVDGVQGDNILDRVWDTGSGMAAGMAKDAERAGNFVLDMFKDLAEITTLSVETKVTDVETGIEEIKGALKRSELRQKLIDRGANPDDVDEALQKLAENADTSGLIDIRYELAAAQKAAEEAAAKKEEENSDNKDEIADADNKDDTEHDNIPKDDKKTEDNPEDDTNKENNPEDDAETKITQLQDAEGGTESGDDDRFNDDDFSEDDPDPAQVFGDKTDETNQDNSEDAQNLNVAVKEIADASTAGDKTMNEIKNTVDQANVDAQQAVNVAMNESNADYNENSFGNQLNNEITDGIKSGFETAGTAIGTAIGEAVVRQSIRDKNHKDRKNDPPTPNNNKNPPKKNRRKPHNSKPPSRGSSSITASSGNRWPVCAVCGRRHKPRSGSKRSGALTPAQAITASFLGAGNSDVKKPTPKPSQSAPQRGIGGGGQVVPTGTRRVTTTKVIMLP